MNLFKKKQQKFTLSLVKETDVLGVDRLYIMKDHICVKCYNGTEYTQAHKDYAEALDRAARGYPMSTTLFSIVLP